MESANFLHNREGMERALEGSLGKRIEQEIAEIPRIHKLDPDSFKHDFLDAARPTILTGLTDDWPARQKWDFEFFAKHCGDTEIYTNLYTPSIMKQDKMAHFIERLHDVDREHPIYLQEWCYPADNPELAEDVEILPHFAEDWNQKLFGAYYSTLWLASAGAKTPVHQDSVHVNIWTAQLYGTKKWYLFNKKAVCPVDAAGNPDFDTFLADPNTDAMHCTLRPGDILFVPYKWWHRAEALDNCISMNTFFVSEEIIQPFVKDYMSIPLALALNADYLKEHHLMRYNTSKVRVGLQAKLMGLDPDNVLGLEGDEVEPEAVAHRQAEATA